MNYNNTPNLVIFPNINNEIEDTVILNYENYQEVKCITYNISNFFCIFIRQIDENLRNINIKHFDINIFENNEYSDEYIISDAITNNDTEDNNPFQINNTFSFNLSMINNYSFYLYKPDDNTLIICFLVNEDNLQKIICYKNTFEKLIQFSLEDLTVYKSCDIKKDEKPEFFNYEKISIIYVNSEHFRIILYTLDKSKYFIIDLNTLSSYLTKDNEKYFIYT